MWVHVLLVPGEHLHVYSLQQLSPTPASFPPARYWLIPMWRASHFYSHLKTVESLVVQLSLPWGWVQSLIRELRSHQPRSLVKKEKKKNQTIIHPLPATLLTAKLPEVAVYAHFLILFTPSRARTP